MVYVKYMKLKREAMIGLTGVVMLKRRDFIVSTLLFGVGISLKAKHTDGLEKSFLEVKEVISAVQAHMFPEGNILPSAKETRVIEFVYETIMHPSYDKDIRNFVIKGAQNLIKREKFFLTLSSQEREKVLRSYEESSYGSAWLSRIMTLTMEGIFSDPVYGANRAELGWKSIDSYGGYPRAKGRYLENV